MPRPKKKKVTVVEQAFEMDSVAGFEEHPMAAPSADQDCGEASNASVARKAAAVGGCA
jgi:hypothetical protein